MNITVKKRYLILPTSETATVKKMRLKDNGSLVFDTDIRVDYIDPKLEIGVDLKDFIGRTLEIEFSPETAFRAYWSDKPPRCKEYPYRPKIHFTAPYGWINDPNGLVEYTSPVTREKLYHMFYQYNPHGTLWANMSWGHAVSHDLLRWEHLEPALYPDELGLMFSGSAIIDKENRTGFKTTDEDVILLYYTAAADPSNLRFHELSYGKYYSQCLAYSTDGGITFKKYDKNPIIPTVTHENRDPKIIWCEELGRYLLALFLDADRFALYTSENLIDFTPYFEYHLEGDRECPDIFPLEVEGEDRKWVITAANGKYIVGEFINGELVIIQGSRSLNYGGCSYAAQTFSDVKDGRRIAICWQKRMHRQDAPYNGQMGIPIELSLKRSEEGYTLYAKPIARYEDHLKNKVYYVKPTLPLSHILSKSAYDLKLSLSGSGVLELSFFGVVVKIDLDRRIIITDATQVPLDSKTCHNIRLIFDTDSVEVFANDGSSVASSHAFLDYNLSGLTLKSSGDTVVETLEISEIIL